MGDGDEIQREADIGVEGADADECPTVERQIDELRKKAAERDEYLELLKRSRADFANYRKRVEEDRKRWGAFAQRDLLAKLLVASDQCRLAARNAETDTSAESLRDAICLVWGEVEKFLDLAGAKVIPTVGETFDPERHEAVSVSARADVPDSTVVAEVRTGYEFAGLVLRPAQVVVAKRPKPERVEPATPDFTTEVTKNGEQT